MRPRTLTKLTILVAGMVAMLGWANRAVAQCLPEQKQKLTPADGGLDDRFGDTVSVSGDVAVVGALSNDHASGLHAGAAYVYRFNGTSWVEEQKLTASDAKSGDLFGRSVAVSGNVIVVGQSHGDPVGINSGAAYAFRYDGTSWIEEQKLIASDGANGALFGWSVSVSGNVAVVGALYQDVSGVIDAGAAYVFRYDGARWIEERILSASDAAMDDHFGESVCVSGDVAVIGALLDDHGGKTDAGSAYVFRYNGTTWLQEQKLTAADAATDDHFGDSASVSGNVAVVGAPDDDHAGGSNAGSVHVFRYDGASWVKEQQLTASDPATFDAFGSAVSVSGDVVVVGAREDDAAAVNAGAAYVFRDNGTSWVEKQKLTATDGATGDFFGNAASMSENVAVLGAPNDQSGSAYIFELPYATWFNYGLGWPGTNGIPSFTAGADPALCTTLTLNLGNSLGAATLSILYLGLAPADIPSSYGGHLLVLPDSVVLLTLPAGGVSLQGSVPCDDALCGLAVYLQAWESDPGASKGISFTPGLQLTLGS